MLLSSVYLGNIQYYTKLVSQKVTIDLGEHYVKQSYRNRCEILTANGPASLIVPVLQPAGRKTPVRDIRIDYSKRWQHQHFQAIVSSYRSSPYFSHYEDFFAPFYHKRYTFLFDLNNGLQSTVLQLLGLSPEVAISRQYIDPAPGLPDMRNGLSPKPRLHSPDPTFTPAPYYQVFSERMPFVPNLSILDLLCCEGPSALSVLHASSLL